MPYKTILVQVDQSRHAAARFRFAAQLALKHDAHLIGAAMVGISGLMVQDTSADMAGNYMAEQMEALTEQAHAALRAFASSAAAEGATRVEGRLVQDELDGGMALQVRCADLVIVTQLDRSDAAARHSAGLLKLTLTEGGRPLLILPFAAAGTLPRRALVAWDGGREATRAVADALPLLRECEAVTLAQFNREPAPRAVGAWLERHGVQAELVATQGVADVGAALGALAAQRGANLIVMGGYRHSPLREFLLGGVTLSMLGSMTVPVLMSH